MLLLECVLGVSQGLCEGFPVGLVALKVFLHFLEPSHQNFRTRCPVDHLQIQKSKTTYAQGPLNLVKSQLKVVSLGLSAKQHVRV